MSAGGQKFSCVLVAGMMLASLAAVAPALARDKPAVTYDLELEMKSRRNLKADCSQLVAEQDDLDEALSVCDAAVEAAPDDGDLYYFRSYAHYYREEFAAAEADATRAIELATTRLAKAYYLRGSIKERQRRLREASTDFKTALELEPEWSQAQRKVDSYAWAYESQ